MPEISSFDVVPLPSFLIPVGTQVVLRVDRRLPGTDTVKPAGSVAEVLQAPTTNSRSYAIGFLDGVTLRVPFAELAVRRREIAGELETPAADLREYVIYRVVVGSRAFGLDTTTSDEDRRGVFLPPADYHWSLFKPPEQIEHNGPNVEEVDWELEKFLRLALQANPNILETLWSPLIVTMTPLGERLRGLRDAFLSRHLYKTYSGYVLSQFRLLRRRHEQTGQYKAKHAAHLIRLLHSGIHAVRTSDILVDVGSHRAELLDIRGGALPFEDVRLRALALAQEFQRAFADTQLPERPDYERVNRFLLDARRSMI